MGSGNEDFFHLGVKGLIQNKQGDVLLLKLNPKRAKIVKGIWDLPGGRVQKGETLETVLKREVYEETGLEVIVQIHLMGMALSNIRFPTSYIEVGLIFALYMCKLKDEYSIRLSKEHQGFDWVTPKRAAELLRVNYPLELVTQIASYPPLFACCDR